MLVGVVLLEKLRFWLSRKNFDNFCYSHLGTLSCTLLFHAAFLHKILFRGIRFKRGRIQTDICSLFPPELHNNSVYFVCPSHWILFTFIRVFGFNKTTCGNVQGIWILLEGNVYKLHFIDKVSSDCQIQLCLPELCSLPRSFWTKYAFWLQLFVAFFKRAMVWPWVNLLGHCCDSHCYVNSWN